MRTAFFVEKPSNVTIRAESLRDANVELYRYNGKSTPAVGTQTLDPGIYLIVSNGSMLVEGVQGRVLVTPNNKDEWPNPSPNLVQLEPGASTASVNEFMTVAMDLSLDD